MKNNNRGKQAAKKQRLASDLISGIISLEESEIKIPKHYPISDKPLYENCKLYAPDGSLLCTCNRKKIAWYIKQNLAEPVDQPEGEPPAAKLLFEPSGKPADERDFYCQEKENKCCCCGRMEQLVRKNVIPREYRKHLPKTYKDRRSHDVVLLCVQCHCSSNIFDSVMRESLAARYNVPVNLKNTFTVNRQDLGAVKAAARALTSGHHEIPEQRREVLTGTIRDHLGREPSQEDIQELRILETKEQTGDISDHGTEVVKQVLEQDGVEEFVKRWRSFFLAKMKPAHLPTGWSVEHRTRDQVAGREESQGDVCGPARQDGEGTSAQVRDEDGSGQVQNGGCSADREPTQINQESDKEDGEL